MSNLPTDTPETHNGQGVEERRLVRCCNALYEASTDLWYATGVIRHAEGHPGRMGFTDDSPESERALCQMEADISGLVEIAKRIRSEKANVKGCDSEDEH